MFPLIHTDAWKPEMPEIRQTAVFSKESGGLKISLPQGKFGIGKWVSEIQTEGGKSYALTAEAVTEAKVNDIYALFTICRADGSMIIREHIESVKREGSHVSCSQVVAVPEEGCGFKLELWLKGYGGEVLWRQPTLTECAPKKERKVRVAMAYIAPGYANPITVDSNVAAITQAVDNAGRENPDVIVLSECMYERMTGMSLKEAAQTAEGTMCTLMRKKAAEYHTYIIYNFHEYDEGEYYNTSILIGRGGETVGKYRKNQLTVTEYELGMSPGKGYPVFETDFGKIGILTCFDHYFPQTAEEIVNNGAEIVFIASAGDAAEKFSARAMDTGVYFAVCGWNMENRHGWAPARVVDPSGKILAQSGQHTVPAVCEIDLNQKIRRHWLSVGPADTQFKGVYGYEKNDEGFGLK